MFNIFDGHNDFLSKLTWASDRHALWPGPNAETHIDLPRMREGGFVGGFFAIWTPGEMADDTDEARKAATYDLPLPAPVPLAEGQANALHQAGLLRWMERTSDGAFKLCLTAGDIRDTIDAGAIAGIMHMEGAEAIDEDLDALHVWHAAGLRSLGPVWSRPTIFGHGVPFRYPGTPDTGEGLSEAGKRLIRACDELGIMIDLSHLNEKGFDDVAAISSNPLVATHSNVHALCTVPRNLTDRQLDMIRESEGVAGLNFAAFFLSPDGHAHGDMGFELLLRHLDYLLDRLGEDGVALGSDFDGARIPDVIGDVRGAQKLCDAMVAHGYGDDLVRKIASENWLVHLDKIMN